MRPLGRADLDEPVVRELLAAAMGFPTEERIAQIGARYGEAGRHLLGYEEEGRLVGLIGLEVTAPGHAVIQHIAVLPEKRRQGIGRTLVAQATALLGLEHLEAETDADAVEFYRHAGFAVESLGEKYPGVERFQCTWHEPGLFSGSHKGHEGHKG